MLGTSLSQVYSVRMSDSMINSGSEGQVSRNLREVDSKSPKVPAYDKCGHKISHIIEPLGAHLKDQTPNSLPDPEPLCQVLPPQRTTSLRKKGGKHLSPADQGHAVYTTFPVTVPLPGKAPAPPCLSPCQPSSSQREVRVRLSQWDQ